jgi:methyl-accepting chemotaxis protein
MAETQQYKRRQYFIKKDYQFRFILRFCILVLAGGLISTGLLFVFSQGTLTSSFDQSRLVVRSTAEAILPSLLITNAITLVLIALATIVVVLFLSHKIAGPMYRFENDLKLIGKGDLTTVIHLREKDQITEMANSLNQMTRNLREKVQALENEVEQVLESAMEQGAPDKVVHDLDHLLQDIGKHFII